MSVIIITMINYVNIAPFTTPKDALEEQAYIV